MVVSDADAPIVAWARRHHYNCYYVDETGLPASCLKVHLGQITAWFLRGRLARIALQVDGELIVDACDELQELLSVCAEVGTCLPSPALRLVQPARRRCYSAN